MTQDTDSLEGARPRRRSLAPSSGGPQAASLLLLDPTPERPLAFGRYELFRRIGAGGMGEVFLARERGPSPRAVVVKKVLPNLVANRVFVGRFLDEVKVVARLDHPNIARVFAMGDVEGEYFLAMEYVQGKTVSRFSRRLKERGVEMPLGVALYLVEKVCEGLQYAHEATDENRQSLHLVHRDLSPANVCLSLRGRGEDHRLRRGSFDAEGRADGSSRRHRESDLHVARAGAEASHRRESRRLFLWGDVVGAHGIEGAPSEGRSGRALAQSGQPGVGPSVAASTGPPLRPRRAGAQGASEGPSTNAMPTPWNSPSRFAAPGSAMLPMSPSARWARCWPASSP